MIPDIIIEKDGERLPNGQRAYLTAVTSGPYVNLLSLAPGPGYCLNVGAFEKRGRMLYFSDGTVAQVEDGTERFGYPLQDGTRYSLWTEAQRDQAKAEAAQARADAAARVRQFEEDERILDALVESARGKLTEAEFNAIVQRSCDNY